MSGICLPIDASAGAPAFPAAQHRVAMGAMMLSRSDRPLGAQSGIRPGAEPVVTVTTTTFTITPFTAIHDPGGSASMGAYLVAFLANETGAINAADANNSRIDRLDVIVPDDPPGSDPRNAWIKYTAGVAGSGAAPAAPARALGLGTITVPKSGGGNPSFSPFWPRTVASGGILPVRSSAEYPAHPYVGQFLDDPANGLQRWNGTAWAPYSPRTVCRVQAQQTTGQHIYTAGYQVLTGWTADYDSTGGAFNAASGVFTARQAGNYVCSGKICLVPPTSDSEVVSVTKNGSHIILVRNGGSPSDSITSDFVIPPAETTLAVGDTIDFRAYGSSGQSTYVLLPVTSQLRIEKVS